MTPATRVRPMRLGDLPAVGRLQRAAFPYDAWTEAGLRDELALGADRWWVVAETGRVDPADLAAAADAGPAHGTGPGPALAGVAGMALGPVCDVLSLAVDPTARRRGLGRALLAELLTQAWSAGAERVLLEVAADNEAALALYAAAGFEAVRRRVGYYAGPEGPGSVDALVLARAWPGRGVRE